MGEPLLLRCPSCRALNRVPPDRLHRGEQPVCGRCRTPLEAANEPLQLTDATFSEQVERSPLPVLVDMWAPWCGPCRFVGPIIDELASELAGRVRVGKLNVDENPATAARFGIQSIPALLVFHGGREVDRIIGAQPKSEIRRRLDRLVA